ERRVVRFAARLRRNGRAGCIRGRPDEHALAQLLQIFGHYHANLGGPKRHASNPLASDDARVL
ncbi:hypothetical protein ABTD95_19860, partial [Acinetobacter baumannii]